MKVNRRIAGVALACIGVGGLIVGGLEAQSPTPERGKGPPASRNERGGERPPTPRTDPALESWIKTLIEKITDPHDEIRDSARAGLISIGDPAVPALGALAEGPDAAKATAARKLIQAIRSRHQMPLQGPFVGGPIGPGGMPDGRPPFNPRPEDGRGQPQSDPFGGPPPMGGDPRRGPVTSGLLERNGPFAHFERILEGLKLDDKQQKQIAILLEVSHSKVREVLEQRGAGKIQREQVPEMIERVQQEFVKGLKPILTEDQNRQLERMMNERRSQIEKLEKLLPMDPKRSGNRPGPNDPNRSE